MKLYVIVFILLLGACVPTQHTQNQPVSESQTDKMTQQEMMQTSTPQLSQLLGATLTVPETQTQLVINDSVLSGALTDLQSNPKGSLQLLTVQVVQFPDAPFVVVPAKVQYVSGAGGIYLFLLEQQGDTFIQKQTVNLGGRLELITLELSGNTLTSITGDPRAGRPPFTQPLVNAPKPGKKVFELRDGQLVELN
jgi:hypothetical protein